MNGAFAIMSCVMPPGARGRTTDESRVQRGVLFIDVINSTRLFHDFGDQRGRAIVRIALDFARGVVESTGGRVIDSIGDELFCEFPDADAAVLAGVRVQQSSSEARLAGTLSEHARFRVGLHFGPVGIEGAGIYGDTVHLARRLASLAKPEQVLTTPQTMARLRKTRDSRFVERTHVKGRPDPVDVVELPWGEAMTLDVSGTKTVVPARQNELVLGSPDGKEVVVSNRNPSVTLGRDRTCDVCLDDARISRLHARVEIGRGGFLIADVSRNGSVVLVDGAPPLEVRRQEAPLGVSGHIRLGLDPALPLVTFHTRPSP
jgi:class 3 adenylate cyclase